MTQEIHRKTAVALADFDFDTAFAALDGLADGDLAWSAPVTTLDDEDEARVTARIQVGTSPTAGGTIEFYIGRADDGGTEKRSGTGDITTTDHGTEGTDADIDRVLGTLGPPVAVITVDATSNIVYTVEFPVFHPGADWNLYVYNNTGAALNNASSPHSVSVRGRLSEIQDDV